MASIIENVNRNIIPLWRTYNQTIASGELACIGTRLIPVCFDRFDEFVARWQTKNSIITAADLINAAIVSDNTKCIEVIKAAEYLVKNRELCSPMAIEIAKTLLVDSKDDVGSFDEDKKNLNFEKHATWLIEKLKEQEIKTKANIGLLRKKIHDFCYNAITYCEIARCYSDLGLNQKARKYMLCAVQLAPHNRYISRCAARFFVHNSEPNIAREILINNGWMKSDPWLLASEIAVDSVMNRSSRFINQGRSLILSQNYSFFNVSELCFAICKEDYNANKRKDWQKMFNMGLRDPNDNSLAQAEFFVKEKKSIQLNYDKYSMISRKDEADTRNYFSLAQYEDAFISSVKWMQNYRFSRLPIDFAFEISCEFLKKYDYSISIIKYWLETHPQDYAMINNLVYVLGLSGQLEEAEQYLSKINIEQQLSQKIDNGICFLATKGLIEYRKGNIDEGRSCYQFAIDTAKRMQKKDLASKARLNMIREEVHCVGDFNKNILKELNTLNTGNEVETEQLRKDIYSEIGRLNRES